jgi:hypothetical protein
MLPTRKLYPTKDDVESSYFIGDQIPAKGSFANYYKKYLENEDQILS